MATNTTGGPNRADALKAAGIPEEAQKAFTGAFEALSGWREEIASAAERNGSAVFD